MLARARAVPLGAARHMKEPGHGLMNTKKVAGDKKLNCAMSLSNIMMLCLMPLNPQERSMYDYGAGRGAENVPPKRNALYRLKDSRTSPTSFPRSKDDDDVVIK